MYFWGPIIRILALASTALAAPSRPFGQPPLKPDPHCHEADGSPCVYNKDDLPEGKISDYPAFECKHLKNTVYSEYLVRGYGWGKEKRPLLDAIKSAGHVTHWDYRYRWINVDTPIFEASFRLPLKSARRLETRLNKLIGINDHLHGGVKCPEVKEHEFGYQWWDFHVNGRD